MAPGAVVSARNLTKSYRGARGVIELTFDVVPGEVFGYLGPNGAGKTTTIRTMLDFISPTSGRIEMFGLDSREDSNEIHRRIGYLPGQLTLYERMTPAEYLAHFSALRQGADESFARELVDRLDLDLSVKIHTLSHGNKQKVGLVQAFMHRPELLVLDEPTQGLDPLIQQEFHKMVTEVRDEGRTVFLSSHVLPEVERLCDRVGIIREGHLVAVESIDDLRMHAVREIEIHFAGQAPAEAFAWMAGVKLMSAHSGVLRLRVQGSVDPVIKVASRFEVLDIMSHEPSLEEIFLTYYAKVAEG
jgi:beta-exotoxin I transport system ATP-binding protein